MVVEIELFRFADLTPLDFFMLVSQKNEVYEINVDILDELFALSLRATASLRKSESQLRLTTRELRTRVLQNALRFMVELSNI
jgi:hypothetical protein